MAWIDDRKEDDWWVETCSKGPQVEFKPWAAAARTDEYLLRLYSSHHFSFKNLHLQSGLSFLFSVLRHINVELQKNEYERRAVDHCCCRLFLRQQTNMPLRRSSDYGGNTEYIGLQEPCSFWNSKFGWWRGWKNPSCFPVTKTPLATYCGMNGFLVQRAVCVCFCCWLVSCYAWVTAPESHFDLHTFQKDASCRILTARKGSPTVYHLSDCNKWPTRDQHNHLPPR